MYHLDKEADIGMFCAKSFYKDGLEKEGGDAMVQRYNSIKILKPVHYQCKPFDSLQDASRAAWKISWSIGPGNVVCSITHWVKK